jgi:GNAT superfamily N-acetyltransferase
MIEVIETRDINEIKPLWQVLNRHQQVHSRHFAEHFNERRFENYIHFLDDVKDYRIEVVYEDEIPLGFIIGSIRANKGCLNDLYVYDDLRGKGIGSYLTTRMIFWLKTCGCKQIEIEIQAGGEEVITFFQKIGFKTAKYTMEYVEDRR